jgi:hypothetical protein
VRHDGERDAAGRRRRVAAGAGAAVGRATSDTGGRDDRGGFDLREASPRDRRARRLVDLEERVRPLLAVVKRRADYH